MVPGRPRINEIAQAAGVSPATVSRVLNNTVPVSEAARGRVLAALVAHGYEPAALRPPAVPSHGLIAFLISDILNPFFPEIIHDVEDEATADGFGLLLFSTAQDPQHEQRALRILAERPVDGVIVCASHLPSQDLIALHERRKMPMVVINRRIDHPDIPSIIVNFETATYHATRHLLDLKHTQIAYLAGTGASDASRARRRGIELALSEVGLTLRAEWCPTTFPNVEGGFQAMSALLSQGLPARPTAVLAYNDMMALGALHAIRAHGLRVPDDISVVGFDDIAMAAHTNPPLTTIAQPKYRLGRLAMQMLRQMMRGDVLSGDGYTLLESPLIVRESTALAVTSRPPADEVPRVPQREEDSGKGRDTRVPYTPAW